MARSEGKVFAQNRKANHDYFIEDTFEAGLVLMGSEIKSIRASRVSIKDAYVDIHRGEAFVNNMHITPYQYETKTTLDPTRKRKLLLHKKQINRLIGLQQQKGYTIVPLKLYVKNGYAKLLIGVGKGKKQYDKREDIKRRDSNREIQRALKDRTLYR